MPKQDKKATPVSTVVTTEKYQQGWQRAREFTLVWPSGYHFGHSKDAATNKCIFDVEATLTNIPYASGYSPKRLQQGTNLFDKKTGNWRVDKLCTILLYEADFIF